VSGPPFGAAAAAWLLPRSLEIDERLGDQAGMATSYSVLAGLHIARDELPAAVGLQVRALAIRLGLGVPEAGRNLGQLRERRNRLGSGQFSITLDKLLDTESKANLLALLDCHDRPGDAVAE